MTTTEGRREVVGRFLAAQARVRTMAASVWHARHYGDFLRATRSMGHALHGLDSARADLAEYGLDEREVMESSPGS